MCVKYIFYGRRRRRRARARAQGVRLASLCACAHAHSTACFDGRRAVAVTTTRAMESLLRGGQTRTYGSAAFLSFPSAPPTVTRVAAAGEHSLRPSAAPTGRRTLRSHSSTLIVCPPHRTSPAGCRSAGRAQSPATAVGFCGCYRRRRFFPLAFSAAERFVSVGFVRLVPRGGVPLYVRAGSSRVRHADEIISR